MDLNRRQMPYMMEASMQNRNGMADAAALQREFELKTRRIANLLAASNPRQFGPSDNADNYYGRNGGGLFMNPLGKPILKRREPLAPVTRTYRDVLSGQTQKAQQLSSNMVISFDYDPRWAPLNADQKELDLFEAQRRLRMQAVEIDEILIKNCGAEGKSKDSAVAKTNYRAGPASLDSHRGQNTERLNGFSSSWKEKIEERKKLVALKLEEAEAMHKVEMAKKQAVAQMLINLRLQALGLANCTANGKQ